MKKGRNMDDIVLELKKFYISVMNNDKLKIEDRLDAADKLREFLSEYNDD